jgi:hypothetical protein
MGCCKCVSKLEDLAFNLLYHLEKKNFRVGMEKRGHMNSYIL